MKLSASNFITGIGILLLVIPFREAVDLQAQCCSPGNPVSGSEYVGILPK